MAGGTRRASIGDPSEHTVWEGRRLSLVGSAAGGRLPSARYRATANWLYWTSGRLGTAVEKVPMWAIRDVDIEQSIQQRARRVGTITVSLQHRDYSGSPTFVCLDDVEHPKDATRLITAAARTARAAHDSA